MSFKVKNGKWITGNLFNKLENENFSNFIKLEKTQHKKKEERKKEKQFRALLKSPITQEELLKDTKRNLKNYNYKFNV